MASIGPLAPDDGTRMIPRLCQTIPWEVLWMHVMCKYQGPWGRIASILPRPYDPGRFIARMEEASLISGYFLDFYEQTEALTVKQDTH